MSFQHIVFNLSGSPVRNDTMEGRTYVVCPMIMLTEGVHSGSSGPLYYPAEELAKTPAAWNYKPVVVYHPEINGQGVSACDPVILSSRKVGVVMNTHFKNGKLHAEAWLEEERVKEVDDRIWDAIENNKMMELSTGVFTDNEVVEGEWNGERYTGIARNYRPDHLALLPDKVGACSIQDGAGFLRLNEQTEKDISKWVEVAVWNAAKMLGLTENAMSHNNIRQLLFQALRARLGEGKHAWIEDVYDDFFIYSVEDNPKLYRLGYTATDVAVTLEDGDPQEVLRVTEYRTIEGTFVGNSAPIIPRKVTTKETTMTKNDIVDQLIANAQTNWQEEDRATLMSLEEDLLRKMVPPTNAGNVQVHEGATAKPGTIETALQQREQASQGQTNNATPTVQDVDQYINNAPPELRPVLRMGLQTLNARKQELITKITSNASNKFTKEYLETIDDINMLEGMAALADQPAPQQPQHTAPAMFIGNAGAPAPSNNGQQEEAYVQPVINWN